MNQWTGSFTYCSLRQCTDLMKRRVNKMNGKINEPNETLYHTYFHVHRLLKERHFMHNNTIKQFYFFFFSAYTHKNTRKTLKLVINLTRLLYHKYMYVQTHTCAHFVSIISAKEWAAAARQLELLLPVILVKCDFTKMTRAFERKYNGNFFAFAPEKNGKNYYYCIRFEQHPRQRTLTVINDHSEVRCATNTQTHTLTLKWANIDFIRKVTLEQSVSFSNCDEHSNALWELRPRERLKRKRKKKERESCKIFPK